MREIEEIIARAIIEVAERPPGLRGPYVFDERDLQTHAKKARAMLEARPK